MVEPPEPTRLSEPVWLEPYPDVLLDDLADSAPGPHARYEMRETVGLAFVTALGSLRPGSARCSCSATRSASVAPRWPACSTRGDRG